MRKRFLFFLLFFGLACSTWAQVGHGGQPLMRKVILSDIQGHGRTFQLPASVGLLKSVNIEEPKKGRPLHFANPHFVELTPENSGHTTVLSDGRLVWNILIVSPGAYSLNLIFDTFKLAQGDSLFIYNPTGETVLGAFTAQNNKPWGGLATAPVPGDSVIVEWHHLQAGAEAEKLKIGAINHDYLNVFKSMGLKTGKFGDSGDCHPDLSCYDDAGYALNGQAVCKVIIGGTELCSGTLLNNTNQDGTPYFLTAGHCMGKDTPAPESVVFIFNYQVPECQTNIEGTASQTLSGSYLRAYADSLDFVLLEMSQKPPNHYRPYYAGWNLEESPQTIGYVLHHPEGDVKKVAVSQTVPIKATFGASSLLGHRFIEDAHWLVGIWAAGTTEGGSSGGGLFLSDHRFIGLLSGGSATCADPENDYFVRLNKIWDHVPSDDASVHSWLNPSGESVSEMPGFDPNDGRLFRLSHFPEGGTPHLSYLSGETGFWSGVNAKGTEAVAEKFSEFESATIYGVYLMPGIGLKNSVGKIDVKVWSGEDTPQTVVGEKKAVSFFGKKDKEMLVMFDSPLEVKGSVFVGYEVDYTAPVDSFGVYQMTLSSDHQNSFLLRNNQGDWKPFTEMASGLSASALWIDLLVGNALLVDTSITVPVDDSFRVYPDADAGQLAIFCRHNGAAKASIIDVHGRVISTDFIPIANDKAYLKLSGLASGIYFLRLSVGGKELIAKFVLQR